MVGEREGRCGVGVAQVLVKSEDGRALALAQRQATVEVCGIQCCA